MFSVYGSLTFLFLFPFWSLAHEYTYARCSCDLKTFKINRHSLSRICFTSWQWSTHSALRFNSFCKNREAGKKPQTTIPNQTTTKKTLFPQRSFLKYLRFSYWKSCRSLHCFFSVAALHHILCSSSFCLPFFTLCTLFSFSYSSFHCSFSFLCPSFSFPRRRLYSCCSSCP